MLMGMGTMVSAAEKESSIPEYSETNDGGMTVNIAGDQEGTIEGSGNEEGINPLWWPEMDHSAGDSISLYKYGWLTKILALRSRYMDMAAILQHLMEEVFRGYIRSHLLYLVQAQMASIIHMIVVRLRKREVIDLIQLSGQQTSLILHVPFNGIHV